MKLRFNATLLAYIYIGFMTGLIAGCATKIPKPIDEHIDNMPELSDVRMNINSYLERRIRWGGVIADVVNNANSSVMIIVEHPLTKQGRPQETDETQGRFLARFKGFFDPVVYSKGREITIVGTIKSESKQLIDQFEYIYPEIVVDSFILWRPLENEIDYYYDPYWPYFYGPWYPPYYPRRYY